MLHPGSQFPWEVVSWNENGGLFIACNAERMAEYERLAEMGKYFGIESTVLSPEEILKVTPPPS